MKVRFLISAKKDMQSIKSYIAKDKPQAAIKTIKKFRAATERLKEFPYSGRVIPETQNSDLHEIIVGNYRIMYQVSTHSVNIFAVYEASRQQKELRKI